MVQTEVANPIPIKNDEWRGGRKNTSSTSIDGINLSVIEVVALQLGSIIDKCIMMYGRG
jgi:hypothetical protein